MRKLFTLLLLGTVTFATNHANGQTSHKEPFLRRINFPFDFQKHTEEISSPQVYTSSEVSCQAKFPGGEKRMKKYLQKSLPNKLGIEVQFVVNEDGGISNISVLHATDPGTLNTAFQTIYHFPSWRPAEVHGKKVKQVCVIQI